MLARLVWLGLLSCDVGGWLPGAAGTDAGADVLELRDLRVEVEGPGTPTDLALGSDGALYVLDGLAGELRVVPPGGGAVSTFPVEGAPVGLGWADGRVWLPRSTEASVEALDPVSGARSVVQLPDPPADLRLTDVVPTSRGLLLVANRGGPWWLDPEAGTWRPFEGAAESGTLFLGAAGPAGGEDAIALVDVQEDRLLVLTPGAGGSRTVGRWGVWEGSFIHPTGVALDDLGRVFVADGLLGVIQVFDGQGAYLGALGRGTEVLRLDHPMGLAVGEGRLYAADGGTGRVISVAVDDRDDPLRPQGMYERKMPRVSLLAGRTTALTRTAQACRSCHDGSVRAPGSAWAPGTRQHTVGEIQEKPLPKAFPVDDEGRLTCATCHIPHRMAGLPAEGADGEIFLREPRARSRLCLSCHPDVVAELRHLAVAPPPGEAGHPLGDLPADRAASGARAIAGEITRVECLDCHAPHGAVGDALLFGAEAATGGCLRCHVGLSGERGRRSHPVGRVLADLSARALIEGRGGFLAEGGEVACLTCHDIHLSPERSGLSVAFADQERCVLCHADRVGLGGGPHDLRASPGGHVATACLACHQLHDAAGSALRTGPGSPDDPTGCLDCHGPAGKAEARVAPGTGHPVFEDNPAPASLPSVGPQGVAALGTAGRMGCPTCHDPHANALGGRNRALLRRPGEQGAACVTCHAEKRPVQGSDHDLAGSMSRWVGERTSAMAQGGSCLACHGMHERGGWRGLVSPQGGGAGVAPPAAACLGCHQAGNHAGGTVVEAWDHPDELLLTTAKLPWRNTGELPLYDSRGEPTDDQQIGTITCLTCHDPHVWSPKRGGSGGGGEGDTQTSFLRAGWEGFCSGCHGEEALAAYRWFHDPARRAEMESRRERRTWPVYREGGP